MSRYLIVNVNDWPVVRGPNVGEILPYFTRAVDGRSVPVSLDEAQRDTWGHDDTVPVPDGMQTVPIDSRDGTP